MFEVKGDAVIASATELRRDPSPLLDRVDRGESVIIQKNQEPVGVLLSYRAYQKIMAAMAIFENIQLALLARHREDKLALGEDGLVSLEDVMKTFGVGPDGDESD